MLLIISLLMALYRVTFKAKMAAHQGSLLEEPLLEQARIQLRLSLEILMII